MLNSLFLIPFATMFALFAVAFRKNRRKQREYSDEVREQLDDKVEVFNPPGPRYL